VRQRQSIDQGPIKTLDLIFVICKAKSAMLWDMGQASPHRVSSVTVLRPMGTLIVSGHSAHADQKRRIVLHPLYAEALSPGMTLAPALYYRVLFSRIKAHAMLV
jgi:hypothetical protein